MKEWLVEPPSIFIPPGYTAPLWELLAIRLTRICFTFHRLRRQLKSYSIMELSKPYGMPIIDEQSRKIPNKDAGIRRSIPNSFSLICLPPVRLGQVHKWCLACGEGLEFFQVLYCTFIPTQPVPHDPTRCNSAAIATLSNLFNLCFI